MSNDNDWRGINKRDWMERAIKAEQERDRLRAKIAEICALLNADVSATRKERDVWWGAIEAWIKSVQA